MSNEYTPEQITEHLLESSEWLFITNEHPDRMIARLQATKSGVTAREMARIWKTAGDKKRAAIFTNVAKKTSGTIKKQDKQSTTKEK
jgi:hypothetical protein